jgi:predicted amidohydrolase YtcJ
MLAEGPILGYADDHLSLVGVKLFADGSLGARSAALLEDYSDDPGNRGLMMIGENELYRRVLKCHESGFQTAIHAIGDRGNRVVLDVYERVHAEAPRDDMRHRIEHAQVVSLVDLPRFSALGVIPSMQFTHCTSDMSWAGDRLGEDRLAGAYAWRSLLSTGCRIPGGSDFPVESINPLLGIYAAVTRKDTGGKPEGGWMPEQCLSIVEAVRAFTVDAAYAAHQEHERGMLAKGFLADFIILSEDIMKTAPERIPGIKVLATVLGGEIVYLDDNYSLTAVVKGHR